MYDEGPLFGVEPAPRFLLLAFNIMLAMLCLCIMVCADVFSYVFILTVLGVMK